MSLPESRRFAGAATVTAVVALLLIVPTVLHFADSAYGQGTGSNGGYGVVVKPGNDSRVEIKTPVGNVTAGVKVNVSFQLPDRVTILEPASVGLPTAAAKELRLKTILEQPRVSGISIVPKTDKPILNVIVNEFLPTDVGQSAIVKAPGTSLAKVQVAVKAPAKVEDEKATEVKFNVMKVIEIHAEGLEAGDVESATIPFRVFPEDLEEMGITMDEIVLLHLVDGEWVELPTTLVSIDGDGVMNFSAETPSFSYFAVAAKDTSSPDPVAPSTSSVMWVAVVIGAIMVVAVAAFVVVRRK